MPTQNIHVVTEVGTLDDAFEALARLQKTMKYLINGQLDFENIRARSIKAENIEVGTLTAEEIKANSITAEKLSVTQLSAIAADLGTITAGLINSVKIFGSYIATAQDAYPRCEMSSEGNLFGAFTSAEGNITIQADYGGAPAFRFVTAGTQRALINTLLGSLEIYGNDGVYINGDNGNANVVFDANRVDFPSWSQMFNKTSKQTLQEAFETKAQKGVQTGMNGGHGHGIPNGTRLAVTDNDGVVVGFIPWSSVEDHTHTQK